MITESSQLAYTIADTPTVGIQNAVKFGLFGAAANAMLYGVPFGMGAIAGFASGLFVPDAKSMDSVYDPNANTGPQRYEGGSLGMFEGLFGNTEGTPQDPKAQPQRFTAKNMLGIGLAAMLFGKGGGFSLPLYGAYLAGMVPYNKGGLEPLMWSSGVIPSNLGGLWKGWGASAGILT